MNDVLDEIDRAILTCLTQDARVSLKVLSARVGLTSPSTAERVKRLEERGVIQGYGTRVNLAALGYSLQALVRVRPLPGLLQKVDKYIQAMPECIESDKVTGEDCFVMRLVVRDIAQLDTLLDGLAERFCAELGPQTAFYATGNLPIPIREACCTPILYRETLITDGLYRIWMKNKKG